MKTTASNPSRVEIITRRIGSAVEWTVTTGDAILAGGWCATHTAARSDARSWCAVRGKTVLAVRRACGNRVFTVGNS